MWGIWKGVKGVSRASCNTTKTHQVDVSWKYSLEVMQTLLCPRYWSLCLKLESPSESIQCCFHKTELLLCHTCPKRSLNRPACAFSGLWSRSADKNLHNTTDSTDALPAALAECSRWQRWILPLMQRDRNCISELTHTGMSQSFSLFCLNYAYFLAKWNLVLRAIHTVFTAVCHLNPHPEKSVRSLWACRLSAWRK